MTDIQLPDDLQSNTVKHLHELKPGEVLVQAMCMLTFDYTEIKTIGHVRVMVMHFTNHNEGPQRQHTITMQNHDQTPMIVNLHGLWYYKDFVNGLKPRCVNA